MDGIIYVNSMSYEVNYYTGKPETVFDISIDYDDGQFIRTEIHIDGHMLGYDDLFKKIVKYFKGNLKIRHY